jgi:hypothetical protein
MSLVPRDALRPTAQEPHSPLGLARFIRHEVAARAAGQPIGVSARGRVDDVTFSVHNEGPAIPAEQQAAIFNVSVRSSEAEGTTFDRSARPLQAGA